MTTMHPKTDQAYRLLHEGTLAFARAERQGIHVDLDYCEKTEKKVEEEIEQLEKDLKETKFYRHWNHVSKGKVNTQSNAQLGWFLYQVKKLKPAKTTPSGQGSTDEDSLKRLGIPEIDTILRIRKLTKIKNTYLNGFIKEQVDGVIHPNFNLNTVSTFRSSSDKPNFQNIPKRDKEAQEICRTALIPRPGHQLLEIDYSGIEVSIGACYHKDETMLKYITDPSSDMHGDTAEQLFFIDNLRKNEIPSHGTLRGAAKNGFVFAQFYGDYYGNCAEYLALDWGGLDKGRWKKGQGIEIVDGWHLSDQLIANGYKSLDQYTKHVRKIEDDFWKRRFRQYARWKERNFKEYQKNGFIDMKTGFRCHGPLSFNDANNYPIQGSAFHCLLWAFIEVDRILHKYNFDSKLIGQIHDAMVLDVHPDELNDVTSLLHKVMIDELQKAWEWIITPLRIDMDLGPVDGSWNSLESYDYAA